MECDCHCGGGSQWIFPGAKTAIAFRDFVIVSLNCGSDRGLENDEVDEPWHSS